MSTSLPYAPELYERNSFRVISTADPNPIISNNQSRILLWITPDVPFVGISPSYRLEQIGNGQAAINVGSTGEFLLWWDRHNILTTLAVYASGFGIGTIFNVTEVFYNPLPTEVNHHAARKFETTDSKVKRVISKQRGLSSRY